MAEALDGLFGPTPFDLEQQQRQALVQQAGAYANQTPLQRAAGGMYQAGGLLGGMAAKALGGYNPNVKMAEDAQTIQKGIDHSTSEGLLAGAQQLKDVNPALAAKYVQAAQALKMKEAEINLKNAQATKALAYRPAGQQDPETIKLLNDMDELESQGLQDTPRYKMLAERVKFLSTLKQGGTGGLQGMASEKLYDPVTGTTKLYNRNRTTGKLLDAAGEEVPADVATRLENPAYNTGLKSGLAQAGAGGKLTGEASAKATIDLIDAVPMAEVQTRQLDQLLNHPGLSSAVGVGLPFASKVPGSKEADFAARFAQVKGGAFLQAFNTLRGGGQITEAEGSKATAALLRAETTQSEVEFKDAVREYIGIIKMGLERLKKKSGATYNMPQVSAQSNAAPMPQGVAPATQVAPMPNGGSGYSGGSKETATKEQIFVMEQELLKPNLPAADRQAIERDLARLRGQNVAPVAPTDFNTRWASLKSGESLIGPDGKRYTKR